MEPSPPLLYRVGSAVAYGSCSVLIMFVNKILLTNYRFPSFFYAGIGQMAATIFILFMTSSLGITNIPPMNRTLPEKIFPLPLFYVINLISGLGGTKKISLPMFTVLRRFSIFMTMVLEYYILRVRATYAVQISVALMLTGSFIAAIYDLSFDMYGYTLTFINNICTAANGVYVKQKLEAKELGKYGLLYYNSLFMILPAILIAVFTGETAKVVQYINEGSFTNGAVICFLASCVCGFALNYSLVLCTHFNSALTTTCVGPIKNLIVTYVGMFSSGDYIFSWTNFIGINVSVLGSVLYTYVTFRTKEPKRSRSITITPKIVASESRQPLL